MERGVDEAVFPQGVVEINVFGEYTWSGMCTKMHKYAHLSVWKHFSSQKCPKIPILPFFCRVTRERHAKGCKIGAESKRDERVGCGYILVEKGPRHA